MSQQEQRMTCPKCGAEMNHHATKIDYSIEDESNDPAFGGGALEEVHTCPRCGDVELRDARQD